MTPELETLKRLHEAATPGPWTRQHDDLTEEEYIAPTGLYAYGKWSSNVYNDTDLVIALRNLAPELIALLEAVEVLCNPPKDCPATCLDQMAVVRDCNERLRAKLREVKP